MARKHCTVTIEGKEHRIVINWSAWSNRGELLVDDEVVKAWAGALLGAKEVEFQVAGEPGILRPRGAFGATTDWDIYVAGKKVKLDWG